MNGVLRKVLNLFYILLVLEVVHGRAFMPIEVVVGISSSVIDLVHAHGGGNGSDENDRVSRRLLEPDTFKCRLSLGCSSLRGSGGQSTGEDCTLHHF